MKNNNKRWMILSMIFPNVNCHIPFPHPLVPHMHFDYVQAARKVNRLTRKKSEKNDIRIFFRFKNLFLPSIRIF